MGTAPATNRYTFGTSPTAADRLDVLARVFAPTTRAFLWTEAPRGIDVAVDLGCGPGHTTRLLSDVSAAATTIGVDRSRDLLARAVAASDGGRAGVGHTAFVAADVLGAGVGSLPVRRADVVFCRFLLAHLPEPSAALAGWARHLGPGGRVLVEEVDAIVTDVEPFDRYLGIVAAMLGAHGQELAVGESLQRAVDPPGLRRRASRVAVLQPVGADVVAMFRSNLSSWRHEPWARETQDPAALDELDRSLAAQVDRRPGAITWRLRQLVWEPAG